MIGGPCFVTTDDDTRLTCPVCGDDYVHFDPPVHLEGRDDYASGYDVRGSVIRIPCGCEQGHRWVFALGFHKGQTFVATHRDPVTPVFFRPTTRVV